MTLKLSYALGTRAAFLKFALEPPTQVDAFIANVESGKDMPPSPETDIPQNIPGILGENPDAPPMPEEPGIALGGATGEVPKIGSLLRLAVKLGAISMQDIEQFMTGPKAMHGTMTSEGPRYVERGPISGASSLPQGPPTLTPAHVFSSAADPLNPAVPPHLPTETGVIQHPLGARAAQHAVHRGPPPLPRR